jgi:hypothetical protein
MRWFALLVVGLPLCSARGDIIEMQNGDRYNGKLLSVGESSVILQNDILGRVTIPRGKVAAIRFNGEVSGPVAAIPGTNSAAILSRQPALSSPTNSLLQQLAAQPDLIKNIENQFLGGADGAAHDKFNDLVSGLISGRLGVEDIRREAKTSADQIRAMRKDLGPDAATAIDGYLAILDQFLAEVPAGPGSTNNVPLPKARPAPDSE